MKVDQISYVVTVVTYVCISIYILTDIDPSLTHICLFYTRDVPRHDTCTACK